MSIFFYIRQTLTRFQLTKKFKNWNSKKVYLVVCRCLRVVCGCLLVVCGRLWSFTSSLRLFVGGL